MLSFDTAVFRVIEPTIEVRAEYAGASGVLLRKIVRAETRLGHLQIGAPVDFVRQRGRVQAALLVRVAPLQQNALILVVE